MTDHCSGCHLSIAPWDVDEVASLVAYQASGRMHPFTGEDGEPLIPSEGGWIAVDGGPVVQSWAHTWMVDWRWDRPGF